MKRTPQVGTRVCGGFTIVELLVASSLTLMVVTVTLGAFINIFHSWNGIDRRMQADREVNIAMSRLVYGVGTRRGLRSAAGVTITSNAVGWTVSYRTGGMTPQTNSFTYSATAKTLVFNPGAQVVGEDISFAQALLEPRSLVVTMRVDRADGALQVRREIGTRISFRNL